MTEPVSGVLKLDKSGAGSLRDPARSFRQSDQDVQVPRELAERHNLTEGAMVAGAAEAVGARKTLVAVETVGGLPPEQFARRSRFESLVAIDPYQRFNLAASNDLSMRIVDMIAPIGKGTRGLIFSPPKAGKTVLLEKIARSIRAGDPDCRLIILLIDERPEEVTAFRRSIDAEVLASSSDQTVQEHAELTELTLAHMRTELECGRDVVVLADSLTRMGRAFNLKGGKGKGRVMSGGVEAGALETPRRFFGLARKIENGGSITIVATALVDTGSRMDQLIFEEFKGTGNSEIALDRSLAESMIWPAINLAESGTRKEHKLFSDDDMKRLVKLRRVLADRQPKEAMKSLLKLMEKYPTNDEFLQSIPL